MDGRAIKRVQYHVHPYAPFDITVDLLNDDGSLGGVHEEGGGRSPERLRDGNKAGDIERSSLRLLAR